jgi:hypothetical protein
MIPPRCAFGASPPGGRRQRPGEAGSAAAAWLAASTVVLTACSGQPASTAYFPLEAGHRWVYEQASTWENNTTERETVVLSTLGSEAVDGLGGAFRRRSDSGIDYWLRADDTGIVRVASKTDLQDAPEPDRPPRPVLKTPLAVGTSWQTGTTTYLLRRNADFPPEIRHSHKPVMMAWRIAALGEQVATRAGRFSDCLRVEGTAVMRLFADPVAGFKDMPLATTEWYCKGVGLVKVVRSEPANSTFLTGGTMTLELIEWN